MDIHISKFLNFYPMGLHYLSEFPMLKKDVKKLNKKNKK